MGCLFDIQNSILIVIIKSPNEGVRLSLLARKIDFQFLKQTTTKPRGGTHQRNCSARLKAESKGRRAEANVFVRITHKSKAKFEQRLPVGKPDWIYPHSFMPPPCKDTTTTTTSTTQHSETHQRMYRARLKVRTIGGQQQMSL